MTRQNAVIAAVFANGLASCCWAGSVALEAVIVAVFASSLASGCCGAFAALDICYSLCFFVFFVHFYIPLLMSFFFKYLPLFPSQQCLYLEQDPKIHLWESIFFTFFTHFSPSIYNSSNLCVSVCPWPLFLDNHWSDLIEACQVYCWGPECVPFHGLILIRQVVPKLWPFIYQTNDRTRCCVGVAVGEEILSRVPHYGLQRTDFQIVMTYCILIISRFLMRIYR